MRTSIALSALASLALSATATPSAASGISPLVCGPGETATNATNTQGYNTSVAKLLTIVGQFQNSTWQGLPQSATSGPDNTINSTRTASFPTYDLVEEIIYNQANATYAEQVFQLANGPVIASANLNLTSYLEDFRVSSTCNGTASMILWTVQICYTSSPAIPASAISSVFSMSHGAGLTNATSLLKLANFTSCSSPTPAAAASSGVAGASAVASASGSAGSAAAKPASGVRTTVTSGLLAVVGVAVLAF